MYRDLVFACAERLFAETDFDRVSMRDIAADAGISPKTLYAVYSGKEEIYREIGRVRSRALLERIGGNTSGGGPILERLTRGVRAYVGFLLEHRSFFQIQMREARNWGLIPSGEGKKEWRHGHRLQADLVREGIAAGVFYDGDPELMAATAIAVMQVQLAGLLERPAAPDPEEITAELVQQILRCLGRFDLPDYGVASEAGSQRK